MGIPDNLTKDGSKKLAQKIFAYWYSKGYLVHIDIISTPLKIQEDGEYVRSVYSIRSDMVNGLPIRRRAEGNGTWNFERRGRFRN